MKIIEDFALFEPRVRLLKRSAASRRFGRCASVALAIGLMLSSGNVRAQATLWWDTNSTTAGSSGSATAAGTWDQNTTSNWTTVSAGTDSTGTWQTKSGGSGIATFSAGTNATGSFTVTVSGTVTGIQGITFEEGTVTLSGGALTLGATSNINTGANNATISSVIAGTGFGINKLGSGYLALGGANTFTGGVTVSNGTLYLTSNSTNSGSGVVSGPVGKGTLTLASGTTLSNLGSSTLTLDNPITASSTVNIGQTNNKAGLILTGNISGNANLNVTSSTANESVFYNVVLRGTNTFTGSINATVGAVILDSTGALPSGAAVKLGDDGYIGFTENAYTTWSAFQSAITASANKSFGSDTIVGVDSFNTASPRTVNDNITFSNFGAVPYLGSATNATVGGSIVLPSSGTLKLTGADGGYLKITSPITATNNVTAVAIGANENEPGDVSYKGYVELAGASTYTGGTTLKSGYLLVGNNTALGTGTLTVTGSADTGAPALAASINGMVLNNDISMSVSSGNGTTSDNQLVVGVPTTSSATDFAYPLQSFASNNLTLTGNITGTNSLNYVGTGTLTLSGGNNTYSGGTTVNSGTLVANNATSVSATGTGSVTVASGATLSIGNGGTAGSVTGGITDNGLVVFNRSDTSGSYTGAISGSGSVTQLGAGTFTLSGTNTYTGATTVSSGLLQIAKQASLYNNTPASWTATNLVVNSGATAAFNVGGTNEFNSANIDTLKAIGTASGGFKGGSALGFDTTNASGGVFSYGSVIADTNGGANSIGITKLGTGTLTLSGANTYTGPTTVSAGTLKAGVASVAGASGAFGNNSAVTLANVAGATLDITGFNTQIGSLTGGSATGGNVTLGAATLTVGGDNTSPAAYAGVISDVVINGTGGSLTKTGTGTLTLSGANSYTGVTTISGGILSVGTLANGGTPSGIGAANSMVQSLVIDGGTLQYTGAINQSTDRLFTIGSGGATIDASGPYGLYLTNLNNIGLAGNTTHSLTLTGTSTYYNSLSSPLSDGSFATSLTKSGTGNWVLAAANTFTGNTTITGGILRLTNSLALADSTVNYNNQGGTLSFRLGWGVGAITLGGLSGAQDLTLSHDPDGFLPMALTVGANNQSTTYSGVLGNYHSSAYGDSSVTKVGTGTWTLSGASTYAGATTINAGTISVNSLANGGSNSPIGASTNAAANLFLNGGTLQYTGAATSTDRLFTLGGNGGSLDASGATGTLTFSNAGSVALDGTAARTLTLTGTGSGSLAPIVADSTGLTSLAKNGAGTWTLSGANTFTGNTTISAGTLKLGASNALSSSTDVNLSATGAVLDVNNNAAIVGSIAGVSGTTISLGSGSLATADNSTTTFAGAITGGTLTKGGTGTLTLSGANTYNGGTIINTGTLKLASTGSLATGADITINGSATFDVFANQTIRGLISSSATSTVNIESGATLNSNLPTINNTQSGGASGLATFAGNLTGAGSFLKNGPGTLTLTGSDAITGLTTVSSGTLQIGSGGTTGSVTGNLTVTSPGTLDFNRSADLTYSAILSGTGNVVKDGAGNVTLSGSANTFNGNLTINSGTLILTGSNTGSNLAVSVTSASNSTLYLQNDLTLASLSGVGSTLVSNTKTLTINTGTSNFTAPISGAGGVTFKSASTILADETYTGLTTINSGTLMLGNGGTTGSVAGDIVISLAAPNTGGVSFNRANNLAFGGMISGNGNLTKSGAGTLTLNGSSTYTGGTAINAGTLLVNTINALPTSTMLSMSSTLDIAANQTVAGFNNSANNSIIQIESGKIFNVTLGNSQFGTFFSGTITDGSVPGGILEIGSNNGNGHTVWFSGSNTYTGGTIIDSGGSLQLGQNGSTATTGSIMGNVTDNGALIFNRSNAMAFNGAISGNGSVTQSGSGTLTLSGASNYTGGTSITSGALVVGGGGTSGSIVGNVSLANNASIGFNRSDPVTFSGVISGTGSLVKSSTGTLTLTGQSTYSGNTTVSSGTLTVGVANALPTATLLSIATSASAVLDVLHSQTVAGFLTPGDLTSVLQLDPGATFTVAMPVANTSTTFAGTVNGTGTFAVSGAGGDTVNLTGSVASTVGTSVGAGATLSIASGGSLGGPIALGTGSILTLNNVGTQTFTNVISGAGTLLASAGSTTLSAPNTYTGGTVINGGKIIVSNTSGSATGTGSVTVNSGGILGGSGIITGTLVLNSGGIVSPGNSPGILTVGATTFAGGATFAFDINSTTGTPGTNWDLLKVTGPLVISATSSNPFVINLNSLNSDNNPSPLSNFNPTQTYSWEFVSTTGGITNFSTSAFQYNASQFQNSLAGGIFVVSQSGNNLFLNFSPVPEPSTWALLASGLGLLALAAHRRRRS